MVSREPLPLGGYVKLTIPADLGSEVRSGFDGIYSLSTHSGLAYVQFVLVAQLRAQVIAAMEDHPTAGTICAVSQQQILRTSWGWARYETHLENLIGALRKAGLPLCLNSGNTVTATWRADFGTEKMVFSSLSLSQRRQGSEEIIISIPLQATLEEMAAILREKAQYS